MEANTFGERFQFFRKRQGFTQEAIAEYLGVTRQAVQKWERGAVLPDANKLVLMSRLFGVSLDTLMLDASPDEDALRHNIPSLPKFELIDPYEAYYNRLLIEIRQSEEEGRDVRHLEGLAKEIDRLKPDANKKSMADIFYNMLATSPRKQDYKYVEPSELKHIKLLCKSEPITKTVNKATLADKVAGGWIGRMCGCLLGKPMECMWLSEYIPFLKEIGNYPMHRYMLSTDVTEQTRKKYKHTFWNCYADVIEYMPSDDDTNYTYMAQRIISDFGRSFTTANVAFTWTAAQVRHCYCTAERVAYVNIINGFVPPDSATYRNPYREWIGAQIRADYYGYINPADPEAAADMAFRDACVSHTGNGIYGSMLVAAMIAAAFTADSIEEIIRIGLSYIPATSRLYEYVFGILAGYKNGVTKEACLKKIYSDFNDEDVHHWTHVIPNAALVAYALLYGEGDYSKTICLAVEAGFDTDCNGATSGSVLGVYLGRKGIPEKWVKPIGNKLGTTVYDVGTVSVDTLVETTLKHINEK